MKIVTGSCWERFENAILFPEHGKNREELVEFVHSLSGDETIVTASLELLDLLVERFKKRKESTLIYSNTLGELTLKEVYELRKYLDFDVRGNFSGDDAPASVVFVEGKTDAKFFKAVFKKIFNFRESRSQPRNLKFIGRVFERDNFDLLYGKGNYVAVIPSEGNSGVLRNLGNFLRAMEVFGFSVDRIGVVVDRDGSDEAAAVQIYTKLHPFGPEKVGEDLYLVGKTLVVPLTVGLPFNGEPLEKSGYAVEDLMLHLLEAEGLFEKIKPAVRTLAETLGRKLRPKEVIYLALSAYGYWGNLEGFYELFVMRSRHRHVKNVLRKAGLLESLKLLALG